MRMNKTLKSFAASAAAALLMGATAFSGLAATPEKLEPSPIPVTADVNEDTVEFIQPKVVYQTFDKDDSPTAHLEQYAKADDVEFKVKSFTAPVQIKAEPVKREEKGYQTEPFNGTGEDHLPPEKQTFNNIEMELASKRLVEKEAEALKEVKKEIVEYTGIEAELEVPSIREMEYTDDATGQVVYADLPLIDQEITATYWSDTFSFPITMSYYDAEEFDLNGTTVKKGEPLFNYRDQFIDLLGLDPEAYEITAIDWDGEPYFDDQQVRCRNALATGRKILRDVMATYQAEVVFPSVPAHVWDCTYQEIVPEEKSVVYTMATDITLQRADYIVQTDIPTVQEPVPTEPEKKGLRGIISAIYEAIKEFVEEHPVISVTLILAIAAFIIYMITRKLKNPCIYDNKVKCPYKKHTNETCADCPHGHTVQSV